MSNQDIHVGMMPSAGMGHLTPMLRLASLLLNHQCKVTVINPLPTVSQAEAQLLSRFLSSLSPPLSAFVSDFFLISPLLSITQTLALPNYLLGTSSATMLSFVSHFPSLVQSLPKLDVVQIPGISPIPISSIPPVILLPNTTFRKFVMEDSPQITKFHGVLINTFEALETQSLEALNAGKVVRGMPQVHAIGPFERCEFEKEGEWGAPLKWLDDKPIGSVVYVGFGSRTAMGRDQKREVGEGLVRSGCKFLWVVKDKIVDKEEEVGLDEVLGLEVVERMREKGLVMKEWVDQSEILGHQAVGGFVSHCGWNSVMEAAWTGVPILAWPQNGDQRINAGVVEMSGLGVWKKDWDWAGEGVVKGEQIGEAIKDMMMNL